MTRQIAEEDDFARTAEVRCMAASSSCHGNPYPSVNDLRLSIVKLQARMKQTNRMTDRRRESNAECSQYGTKPIILLMFLPIFTPFYIAIINTSK